MQLRACGILVHVHIKTPLTARGTQVLFVVKWIKLHLTALIYTNHVILMHHLHCLQPLLAATFIAYNDHECL